MNAKSDTLVLFLYPLVVMTANHHQPSRPCPGVSWASSNQTPQFWHGTQTSRRVRRPVLYRPCSQQLYCRGSLQHTLARRQPGIYKISFGCSYTKSWSCNKIMALRCYYTVSAHEMLSCVWLLFLRAANHRAVFSKREHRVIHGVSGCRINSLHTIETTQSRVG